jgi:hypothetical protein
MPVKSPARPLTSNTPMKAQPLPRNDGHMSADVRAAVRAADLPAQSKAELFRVADEK